MFVALVLSLATVDALGDGQANGGGISSDAAAAIVGDHSGGRILGVKPANSKKAQVYRVKVLLSGGRVRVYRVDGRSGRILK